MIHQPTPGPYVDKPRVCERCGTPLPDLATIEQECPGGLPTPREVRDQVLLHYGFIRGLAEVPTMSADRRAVLLRVATMLSALIDADRLGMAMMAVGLGDELGTQQAAAAQAWHAFTAIPAADRYILDSWRDKGRGFIEVLLSTPPMEDADGAQPQARTADDA